MSYIEEYIEELKFPSTPEEIKVSAGRINDEMSAIYRGNWVECIHNHIIKRFLVISHMISF